MPRILGVLGGMGPEATILLMRRILEATPARDDADHIPLIVDNNTQVPSRIAHLIEGTGEDPTPVLQAMARRLETAGAQALLMPCNTAHSYLGAVAPATSLPFLDMTALTAAELSASAPAGPIGILASPAVEITGVFRRAFAAEGREVIYPEDRDAMLAAIRAVKAGREAEAEPALRAALVELAGRGAAGAAIGCSEFSLLTRRLEAGAPLALLDSLDALVRAAVRFAMAPEPAPETIRT